MRNLRPVSALLCGIAVSVLIGYTPSPLAAQGPSGSRDKTSREWAEYAATLPKDVYPDSGSRVPLIKREELDDLGKKLYDAVVSAPPIPGVNRLMTPSGIRLYSPRLAEAGSAQSRYLRNESFMTEALYELAILVTARELNQQFEWVAHEPQAREAGLEEKVIDIVKYRKPLTGLGEKETAIIQVGREAVGKRKVSSDTYARAVKLFGERGLVDLVTLMGNYVGIAVLLETFDQHLPPGQKPPLPIP